jgi:predicted Zn-dependent protease
MIAGHERTLLAAQGYTELQMFDDALAELDGLPPEPASDASTLELRATILMQAKRWLDALTASRALCEQHPEKSVGFIHMAFCLHELGQPLAARDALLGGPASLHKEPTFHYNLACYECSLGNLELARMHLEKSFELDKKYRDFAKTDPDLAPLRK